MAKPGFYAVRVGRQPGVYTKWADAEEQVKNFTGAKHKKFTMRQEAEAFATGAAPTFNHANMSASTSASTSTGKNARAADDDDDGPPAKKKQRKDSENKNPDAVFGTNGNARTVFCDGSCLGNGKKGSTAGIGVFWGHDSKLNLAERLPGPQQTNNRAEMYAVARILETDPNPELPLTICTDSAYTIGVFSQWLPAWRRNNWKTASGTDVANPDLIRFIVALISDRMPPNSSISSTPTANVSFYKVKAHVGIDGNEQADRFAKAGANLAEQPERDYVAERAKVEKDLVHKGLDKVENTIKFDVDFGEDDLLSEEELRRMSDEQDF